MKKIVPAPYIDQTERWVNGCESISSVMLLQAVGIDIDPDTFIARRSEERRVGKECRSRGSPYH